MKNYLITLFLLPFLACTTKSNTVNDFKKNVTPVQSVNFLQDFKPVFEDGDINVIVEIPAGTNQKWEVNKTNGLLQQDSLDSKPRVINYLSYPANYGMIPKTILPKELGGDGDPLDVIVLGASEERGTVLKSKLIGVLYLTDNGEQDDKLIAVSKNSPFYKLTDINQLQENYVGVKQILQTWFTSYKGKGKLTSKGFGDRKKAEEILRTAIEQYQSQKQSSN